MISFVNSIIGKFGLTGCLLALDSDIPYMIRFDFPCGQWKVVKNSEWDYVGNPGGRVKYPVFAGMGEEIISFNTFYDLSNRNDQFYMETAANSMVGATPFKGLRDEATYSLQASSMDYIYHIKSLYNKIKSPKYFQSKSKLSKAGSILTVSQAQSEPTPNLCLLVKNPSEAYVGYVIKAEITESNFNSFNYPTRLLVDVEFAVVPDVFVQSMRDLLEEIHALRSVGGVL